jgi:hypothetical protein
VGSSDPRTWAGLARRYRVVGFVALASAVVAFPFLGPVALACLLVVSVTVLLAIRSVEATGQLPTAARVIIALAFVLFAEAVVSRWVAW